MVSVPGSHTAFQADPGDGERVRRFDKRVGLGAEREHAVDDAIQELQRLADQGASEEEQLAAAQTLRDLTGEQDARTLDDWLQWRNEHQAAQPRQEWLE
ncbi:MAG TPA: hypothetical protein VK973_17865, partial [Arenicellales bacterium]|nr:hypothetical protein [Arenicellales bacterium]